MRPVISKEATVGNFFWLWPLFCFQGGLINSGGLMATQHFVSHVTGLGTRIGMEFIQSNFLFGLEMMLIPVGFILGSAVAGHFQEFKHQRYSIPFIMISSILLFIAIFGSLSFFGSFGGPQQLQRDFILLFFLCFACGLQNGVLASLTGGLIRTTHITGVATDLGLGLVRLLKKEDSTEKRFFYMRLLKMIFFALGATFGALAFKQTQFEGFIVPALLNLVLFIALKSKLRTGMLGI